MIEIYLVDTNPILIKEWEKSFADYPNVHIIMNNILSIAENTIVSPANGFGLMDGGIDADYQEYFGSQLQRRLLKQISMLSEGVLKVGEAILIKTNNQKIPYMISAPTMEIPEIVNYTNVFFAMSAILRVAYKNRNIVNKIFCPGLATGIGKVDEEDAAIEMCNAYKSFLRKLGK